MQHNITKELSDFIGEWYYQLINKYQTEWRGQPGDSDAIYKFLLQNEHHSDFLHGLMLFKKYINHIDNPIHATSNPNSIPRTIVKYSFLDAQYRIYHPELKKLKDILDDLLRKYIPEPSYFFSLASVSFEMIIGVGQFIVKNQLKSSAIIYSIASQFTQVSAQPEIKTLSNQEATHDAIQSICSNKPFIAANIPDVRYTKLNNNFIAQSCYEYAKTNQGLTQKCLEDNKKVTDFNIKNPNKAMFDKIIEKREQFKSKHILNEAKKLIDRDKIHLTPQQIKQLNHYLYLLDILRYRKYLANSAKKLNAGNCDEHASYATISIFKVNQEQNTFTNIQFVIASDNDRTNHIYLMIDSDAPDVEIKNNPAETEKYLSNIKTGYLCDTWNGGNFEKIAENKNDIYKKWASVKVKTLTEYFDVSELPDVLAKFIKKKLEQLDASHLFKKPSHRRSEL